MGETYVAKMIQKLDLRPYLTREPVIIAVLSVAAMVCFGAVSALSGMYHDQQRSLAAEWFDRGSADLKARRFGPAADEFRTALLYSRDNYTYLLNLAEALLGAGKSEAASVYFSNLWDREPANGTVNLELARLAARAGQPQDALRYFHNAIYATWPDNSPKARQDARLELIRYLLKTNNRPQAQSELIALAANLADDPSRQTEVGDLFMETHDYADALAAYRQSLKAAKNDAAALAGAGRAAFELGRYSNAEQYLREALAANSGDQESADLLQTAELVMRMNPFLRYTSADERYAIVAKAFEDAHSRLQACPPPASATSSLADQWAQLKPQVNARDLRRDPDLVETAMDLVFDIERQTATGCAPPTPIDRALLLIARLHEGN